MCAATLVPAACGDDDGRAAAPSTTTSPTATPTTATTTTSPTTTTTAAATTTAATHQCGQVGFTPDSEDAAGGITATGVTCDEARAFVGVAGRRTSSGGPPVAGRGRLALRRHRRDGRPAAAVRLPVHQGTGDGHLRPVVAG